MKDWQFWLLMAVLSLIASHLASVRCRMVGKADWFDLANVVAPTLAAVVFLALSFAR